ncbi:MAG: hypothetical protein ABIF12_01940 [bacterium]
MKYLNIKNIIIIINLISAISLSASNSLFLNKYKFIPQNPFTQNSSFDKYLQTLNQQNQTINDLLAAITTQNNLLIRQQQIISKDDKKTLPESPSLKIIPDTKFKTSKIINLPLQYLGEKSLDTAKFFSRNFTLGIKDVFAKGLKKTGSLSLYLPLAGFIYWRLTGKSPFIPIKELFRFSRFSLKILLSRGTLPPQEELQKAWYYYPISWLKSGTNKINFYRTPETEKLEAEVFKNRFSPDELVFGGGALLAYFLLFR